MTRIDYAMERLVQIAADSASTLRKSDVHRVLSEAGNERHALAKYIAGQRPELSTEITETLADIEGGDS